MTTIDPALAEIAKAQAGAFVESSALLGLSAEAAYAVKTRAVLLSRPKSSWASHHAALGVSGLPLVSCDLDRFDVCAKVKRENRSGSVITHPLPKGESALLVKGVRVVSTETAIVQTAARYGVRTAVVALDAALGAQLVTLEGFAALHNSGCSRGLKPPVSSSDLPM